MWWLPKAAQGALALEMDPHTLLERLAQRVGEGRFLAEGTRSSHEVVEMTVPEGAYREDARVDSLHIRASDPSDEIQDVVLSIDGDELVYEFDLDAARRSAYLFSGFFFVVFTLLAVCITRRYAQSLRAPRRDPRRLVLFRSRGEQLRRPQEESYRHPRADRA